ncbi:hypothetical protein J31TS4_28020 [Paenibacillus sp. J31TS4]|nr:hypothetical protein J31TS4_28020 [Paenibacillus sp. J31TS4]
MSHSHRQRRKHRHERRKLRKVIRELKVLTKLIQKITIINRNNNYLNFDPDVVDVNRKKEQQAVE